MSGVENGRLMGKRTLILGVASADNMGHTIARRFAEAGARVAIAARNGASLEPLAAEIDGIALSCDLTNRASVETLVRDTCDRLGGLDVVINATGWGLVKPFLETTEEELARMTDLQFKAPFHLFQCVLPVMARGGSIIQISSATATIMLNDHAAYMGTKAGIDHVIRCIAHEFGEWGIRANSISPGLTETPMAARAKEIPGLLDAFIPSYPLGRIGTKDDIAAAAIWLASDECFMTGENLQVNGGLTLRRNPSREEKTRSIAAAAAAQAG